MFEFGVNFAKLQTVKQENLNVQQGQMMTFDKTDTQPNLNQGNPVIMSKNSLILLKR